MDMVGLSVVCPVCGTHEELEVRTTKEVKALLTCALPPCPVCGWGREEDRSDPSWERRYRDAYPAAFVKRIPALGIGLDRHFIDETPSLGEILSTDVNPFYRALF